jgi:O-antigen/teichoic acid export membrane protein
MAYCSEHACEGKESANGYFAGGMLGITALIAVSICIIGIFSKYFSFLFFGDPLLVYLIPPLLIFICGISLQNIAYGYFRGMIRMNTASWIKLANSLMPLFVIFYFNRTALETIIAIGVTRIIFSVGIVVFIFSKTGILKSSVIPYLKKLFKYGVMRFPTDIGYNFMMILPVTFVAHMEGVQKAGLVALGLTFLSLTEAVFAPIGLVMLPVASKMVAQKEFSSLSKRISKVIKVSFVSGILFSLMLFILAGQIILIYLGSNFLEVVKVIRVLSIGMLPLTVYCTLRSIIDAYYDNPRNTKNTFISLCVFLLCSGLAVFFKKDYFYILTALILGLFMLAGLTLMDVKKISLKHTQKI